MVHIFNISGILTRTPYILGLVQNGTNKGVVILFLPHVLIYAAPTVHFTSF